MPVKLGSSLSNVEVDNLIESLKWVSSPTYANKALGLARLQARLLNFLKEIFPYAAAEDRRPDRKYRPHLVTGFRAYQIPGLGDKQGFVIKHRGLAEPHTRKLLASLELGSRAYVQHLKKNAFSFIPGDGRGERHSKAGSDFASSRQLRIPARQGGFYMRRAMAFAREQLAKAKPEYFKQVKASVKRKERS